MTTYLIRFIGDPCGYRITTDLHIPRRNADPFWLRVYIGFTDKAVEVDVSKAYLVETIE